MAKATTKKEITMEEALWKSADKLRGSVEPAEYKHVVLSLFFLKFASDKFETQRNIIIEKFGEKFVDNVAFYTKDNVFFLPEESRWSYIIENAKQDDVALKIDTALYNIEKANPALKGALPDNYYSRLHIDTAKLASLLDEIDRINTKDEENDIIGRVYEYFLSKFALAEGKGKGEFYTPKSIVNLIAEMLSRMTAYSMTLVAVRVVCSFSPSSSLKLTAAIKRRALSTDRNILTPRSSSQR